MTGGEEVFATRRALSRLAQMRQPSWWATAEPNAGRLFQREEGRPPR